MRVEKCEMKLVAEFLCFVTHKTPPEPMFSLSFGQLTVFGGETLEGVNLFSVSGDCAATVAMNAGSFSLCLEESNGVLRLVLTFSHMMTCLRSVSGANLREQTGHRSKRMFGGGISMKISFNC